MRAGSLLCFFYLFGNYENPTDTRNWTKSIEYLKDLISVENELTSDLETRGSNHRSFLLFLIIQSTLIEDFEYFKSDLEFYSKVTEPEYIKKLLNEMHSDFSSQTN